MIALVFANHEVPWAIIETVSIDVMDNRLRRERMPKGGFCYDSVLVLIASATSRVSADDHRNAACVSRGATALPMLVVSANENARTECAVAFI